MLAGVEGHTGTARVPCMTCRRWVAKPDCAVASRIWRVRGELRACSGRVGSGRYGPNTARKKGSDQLAPSEIMLSLQPDAHLGSRIEPATKSLSGPCRGRATPSKPRANGLSEGRSGYLGGRRSAGRRRRRSAGRSAGRWRPPCEALDALRFQFQGSLNFIRKKFSRISIAPPGRRRW